MRRVAEIVLITGMLAGCLGQPDYRAATTTPSTVGQVDLTRYQGLWYEIARYPNPFEDTRRYTCVGVTAEYALRDDGKIDVTNSCRQDTLDGKVTVANGVARSVSDGNDQLRVRFAPGYIPFTEGDYWVFDLLPDYSAALVGDPSGKYLWILSRTPRLDDDKLDKLLSTARNEGFETEPLKFIPQPPAT